MAAQKRKLAQEGNLADQYNWCVKLLGLFAGLPAADEYRISRVLFARDELKPFWQFGKVTLAKRSEDENGSDSEDEEVQQSSKSFLVDLQKVGMPATSPAGQKLRAFHAELSALKGMNAPDLKALMQEFSPRDEPHVRINRSIAVLAKTLEERYSVVPMKDWNGKDILFKFNAYPTLPSKVRTEWIDMFEAPDVDGDDEEPPPAKTKQPKKPKAFGWGASL